MASSFFIQIIVLAACLQKTGSFASNWPLARAKFASVWPCHPYYQRIFQIKYPRAVSWIVGIMPRGCGLANAKQYNNVVKTAFLHTSCLLVSCLEAEWPPVHANCNWVAASCLQIVLCGRQSHANFHGFYSCCMRLAATRIQFACDGQPLGYNLYATGRQSHENFACACGQLHAKPPVFCRYAARTIIWIKKWRLH